MTETTCTASECGKPRKTPKAKYCSMHLWRLSAHGSLEKPEPTPRGKARPGFVPKYDPTCQVGECGRETHLRGYCATHYARWRINGDPGGPIEERQANKGKPCSTVDCDREALYRSLCRGHYLRAQRGIQSLDPIQEPRREWVAYSAVHRRLRVDLGPASTHPCVDCDAPAKDWSYDNLDPDECQEDGMSYSFDATHYQPRCRRCHKIYDLRFAASGR